MARRVWVGVAVTAVFAALILVVSAPVAAQDPGVGEVNLTLTPSDSQVTPNTTQTYDVVVEGPDAGLGAYALVTLTVSDPSVAKITDFARTRETSLLDSEIRDNNRTLVLNQALLGEAYAPQSAVTIANVTLTAVGSKGDSTVLGFNRSVTPGLSDQNDDAYSVNAFRNATLSIPAPPTFQVSALQPQNTAVNNGTTVDVSATVENTGDRQGTQSVTLSAGTLTRTKSVTLAGGANTTVTFAGVETGRLGPGTYGYEVASANDSVSAVLTVQRPPTPSLSGLSIGGEGASATVANNSPVSVNVTNVGDVGGSFTLTLNLTDENGTVQSTTTVQTATVGSNETVGTTVQAVGEGLPTGAYTVTVSAAGVATVSGSLSLSVDVLGTGSPARDADGDGLYEDVRGDSNGATILDVQTLFDHLDSPVVQNNAAAFAFQGDDADVGVLDIQALYDTEVAG